MSASLYISMLPTHTLSTAENSYAFAVLGKTWGYKDELKGLGGRFSRTIGNSGVGWLFAEKKLADVQHFIERAGEVRQDDKSDVRSQGTTQTIMTDKEFEKAIMIEDLLHKTMITTIESESTDEGLTKYIMVDGSEISVKIDDVCVAEWGDGRYAIMKKSATHAEGFELLPFLGTINEKHTPEGYTNVMKNFLCYITLSMLKPTVYYTDGYCSYAYCDEESFDKTIELLDLEME